MIELLVVISIISLLSSVVLSSVNAAKIKARDTLRKQQMVQLRTALEMYYGDNASYPLPYGGAWAGYAGTGCNGVQGGITGATGYIINLAPTYIGTLPIDPSRGTAWCTGYVYYSDGANYKLVSHIVYEGTYPTVGQPFYDPARPTWGLMVCSGEPACTNW